MKSLNLDNVKTLTVEEFNKLPASEQTQLYINRQLPEPIMDYLFSYNEVDNMNSEWGFYNLSEEDDFLFDHEEIKKLEEEYELEFEFEGYIF